MTTLDFFLVSAGIGIWVMIISWFTMVYKTLRLISQTKSSFKFALLTLVNKILGFFKGGENNDNKQ